MKRNTTTCHRKVYTSLAGGECVNQRIPIMNRDQFRGITLAALMVLSVVGGAATVTAAGDTDVNVELSSSSVDVGSTTTADIVITEGGDGVQGAQFSVNLSDGSAADITDVSVAGSPGIEEVNYADDNSSVGFNLGYIPDALAGSNNLVIATVTIEGESAGSTDVTTNVNQITDNGGNSYSVQEQNGASLTVGEGDGTDPDPDPEPEPVTGLPGDADRFLQTSGPLFWQGQQLFFQVPEDANEDYVLYRTSGTGSNIETDFVTEVTLNDSGAKVLDTGRDIIGAGTYALFNTDNDAVVFDSNGEVSQTIDPSDDISESVFTVREQSITATLEDNQVTQGDSTTVSLTSTRGSYSVNVSAEDLEDSDIESVFGSTTLDLSNTDSDVTLNTSAVDAGTYTFEFDVTDTTASSSVNLTVEEQDPANVEFAFDPGQSVRKGNFLELPVTINNTDSADVRIGSDEVGYNVTATLTDGNSDGQVTLRLNTYLSGFAPLSDALSVANSEDSVSVSAQTEAPGEPLDSGTYDLTLIDADTGEELELSSFLLQDRDDGAEMALWTAPRSAAGDVSDRSDVTAAIESGTVTPSNEIAAGDLLIHQIEVNDFDGLIAAVEGDNGVETLTNAINNNVVDLTIEQTDDSTGINQQPKTLNLGDSADALTVFFNASNDELYVIAETANLQFDRGSQSGVSAAPNDVFDVTFDVTDQYVSPEDAEEATQTFSVEERTVTLTDSDDLTLRGASGQTVTGEASVAPGSQYTIEVRGPNLLDSESVTVGPDGNFNATFDLSRLSEGDNLRATLSGNGASDQVTYTIAGEEPVPTASVTIDDQTRSEGDTVRVSSVDMSEGGFVAIHEGGPGGDVIGASNYIAGSASNVAISLDEPLEGGDTTVVAMPHLDTNNNQEYDFGSIEGADGPYTSDGAAVTDSAVVTVPTPEPTETTEPTTETTEPTTETTEPTTEPTTETTEPAPDTTETTEAGDGDNGGDEETTSEGGPGFGIVAALIALIAAALLAVRRNN